MADSKDILEISKALQAVLVEVKNSARMMGLASEKLSNVGIDKLTEELKRSLKQRKLLNDLEVDAISDSKKMAATLDVLENQFAAILKIEEEVEKEKIKSLKTTGAITKGQIENQKKLEQDSKNAIAAKLEEINISVEYAAILKSQLPLIRQETESRAKSIASVDGLNKIHENLKSTLIDQVKGFATFGNALSHLTKATSLAYDQANRLSSQGMLGAFETLQYLSPKLMLSAKDLEEILNKNRDLVNQMGGGINGVKQFSDEIYKTKDQLSYLGKDWAKASVGFIELSKKSGLTPKDGKAYRTNLDKSISSFKDFSSMFGDTPDQFKALQEGMQIDENIRQQLNNLNKIQLGQRLEEIRQQTYHLKLMGLSSEQIVDFNSKLAATIDPRKSGAIGEHQMNAVMLEQLTTDVINNLSQGTPEQQAMAVNLRNTAATGMAPIQQQMRQGNNPAQFAASVQNNPEYVRALAKGVTEVQQNMPAIFGESSRIRGEMLGQFREPILNTGGALATRQAAGADITGKTPQEIKAIQEANKKELLAENGPEAKLLALSAAAYERVTNILDGPFAQALLAATAALGAFALTGGGALGGIAKGAGGLLKGGAGGILGKLGMVGTAGSLGYSLGKSVINPMLNSAVSTISGRENTLGGGLFDLFDTNDYTSAKSSNGSKKSKSSGATSSSTPSVISSSGGTDKVAAFTAKYGAAAAQAGAQLGVDPKIILGQWGLETGWGRSVIPGTNNLGNIKSFSGNGVSAKDNMTGSTDKYRAYDSPESFATDYVSLIKRKYPGAVGAGSPGDFATALKAGGYAEDPNYVSKVQKAATMAGITPLETSGGSNLSPSPTMQTGVGGNAGVTGSLDTAVTTPSVKTDPIEELRKHTTILASIAQNTATRNSNFINPNGYKQDTALVMGGIPG